MIELEKMKRSPWRILKELQKFGWLRVAAVTLIFAAVFRVYLPSGVPYTHDGENHLARFANYKIALREGQLPPRWAPNLVNGYGYPVFNFNYPLANILSLPFSFFKFNYTFTFKLLMIGFLIFGTMGLIKWLRLIGVKNKDALLLAIGTFLLNPFVINLIYYRGGVGEVMAINTLIWLFFILEKIKQKHFSLESSKTLFLCSLVITAFLLSHNILVMFGLVLLGLYGLLSRLEPKGWKKAGTVLLIGIGLSSWFWLPAYFEKQHTVLDDSLLSNFHLQHFPTFDQLLTSPLKFGFSFASPVDSLSFNLGPMLIFGSILFLAYVLAKRILRSNLVVNKVVWPAVTLILLLSIFQLSLTLEVWRLLPFVNFIQFPWRLSAFIVVLSPLFISIVYQLPSKLIKIALWIVMLWQMIVLLKASPADFIDYPNIYFDTFSQSTSTAHENTAKNFSYTDISNREARPEFLEGEADYEINYWTGTNRSYKIFAHSDIVVVEPTMNFPGWLTWVDGELVNHIDDENVSGRIAFSLSGGDHVVETRFTQSTPFRVVGNSLFVATALILLFILVKNARLKSTK